MIKFNDVLLFVLVHHILFKKGDLLRYVKVHADLSFIFSSFAVYLTYDYLTY